MCRHPGLIAAVALFASAGALAQPSVFPTRSVTIVVPFPPGGGTDTGARIVAQKLSVKWGQPVVIENRGGAAGQVGADYVVKARPDGYTLMVGNIGTQSINPALYKKMAYDPDTAFAPISLIAELPLAMMILHVPYRGGGPAISDLLAGHVQLSFMTVLEASGNIKAGKLRALAVTSSKRVSALPDVPTLGETVLPGFNSISWIGLLAPGGTPRELVDKISADVREVLAADDVKARLVELGAIPMGTTPAQFSQLIDNDRKRYARIIKERNITLD